MRALTSSNSGLPGIACELAPGVTLANVPAPSLSPGQALVDVDAASIHRADALQLHGDYPPPEGEPDIPGLAVVGRILSAEAALHQRVSLEIERAMWQRDPILALVPAGGLADLARIDLSLALPLPVSQPALRMVQGGGLEPHPCTEAERAVSLVEPCAAAWLNLKILANLQPGQTILIHGGSGAVGTIATQLAAHLGARIIATAGTPQRAATCRELGAHAAIDYHDDVAAAVGDYTNGNGVDAILDVIGAGGLDLNTRLLAPEGTLLLLGLHKGRRGELDLARVMTKRLHITGATLRSAPPALKRRVIDDLLTHVWPLVEDGVIRPIVDAVYPLDACSDAFARLAPAWFSGDDTRGLEAPFGGLVARMR